MNLKKRIEKIKRKIKITTATAAPAPIFERAKACSYTLTVNVLVPAFPPVRRKMSSNLLKVQINLNKKRILKIMSKVITPYLIFFQFFDEVKIEDPRVSDLGKKIGQKKFLAWGGLSCLAFLSILVFFSIL